MEALTYVADLFLHLDQHLNHWATVLGPWLYVVLFVIIFAETGFVVTPFLPGDSLLFAVGALASLEGSPISLPVVLVSLIVAAVGGNMVNYAVGRHLGPRVFSREDSWFLNKEHLVRTQRFYDRHGGKTIALSRFMPIIRTFAPFVAGVGRMEYRRFAAYNFFGGVAWVTSFLVMGFFFGQLPIVKERFHYVVVGIVAVSLIPIAVEMFKAKFRPSSQTQG